MRAAITVVDLLLWLIQGIVMLVFVVPLQRIAQALTWVSWKALRHLYYPVVLARRRITGRPRWQDTDVVLGIPPPPRSDVIIEITDADLDEDTK